jgi:hypothetical protein
VEWRTEHIHIARKMTARPKGTKTMVRKPKRAITWERGE